MTNADWEQTLLQAMLKLVDDPVRRGIAAVLIAGGYCAVVLLTWGDDAD